EVLAAAPERLRQVAVLFEPTTTLQQLLRRLLVLPEVRLRYAGFDLCEFVSGAGGVKDSSAGPSRAARGLRICGAGRPVESLTSGVQTVARGAMPGALRTGTFPDAISLSSAERDSQRRERERQRDPGHGVTDPAVDRALPDQAKVRHQDRVVEQAGLLQDASVRIHESADAGIGRARE